MNIFLTDVRDYETAIVVSPPSDTLLTPAERFLLKGEFGAWLMRTQREIDQALEVGGFANTADALMDELLASRSSILGFPAPGAYGEGGDYSPVTDTTVKVNWYHQSDPDTYFRVQVAESGDGFTTWIDATPSMGGNPGNPQSGSMLCINLTDGNTYKFRVRGEKGALISAWLVYRSITL